MEWLSAENLIGNVTRLAHTNNKDNTGSIDGQASLPSSYFFSMPSIDAIGNSRAKVKQSTWELIESVQAVLAGRSPP